MDYKAARKFLLDSYNESKASLETVILTKADSFIDIASPLFVGFEITSRCNLVCGHCRAANNLSRGGMDALDFSNCCAIIDKLHDASVYTLGITGGEPFVRNDAIDIVEHAKKKNMRIILYTNATLITDDIAQRLANVMEDSDIVHVSLDSADPLIHNKIRGRVCFEKALEGMACLTKRGIKVRLNAVPTAINIHTLKALAKLSVEYGCTYFSGSPLWTIGRARKSDLEPSIQSSLMIEMEIAELLDGTAVHFDGGISGAVCKFKEVPELSGIAEDMGRRGLDCKICDAGTRKIFIDARGDVYPCSLFAMHEEFCVGNLAKDSVSEVWNHPLMIQLKTGIPRDENICGKCQLWPLCSGGCLGLSYEHFGDMSLPDPRCVSSKGYFDKEAHVYE